MIAAAALGRPNSTELALRIRTGKAYFRPNETMLRLADSLLGASSGLVELSRSVPVPTQTDKWGPARIRLTTPSPPEQCRGRSLSKTNLRGGSDWTKTNAEGHTIRRSLQRCDAPHWFLVPHPVTATT